MNSLATGSVVSYAGDLSLPINIQKLKTAGWLLCDGSSYVQSDYPDLFAAIGVANGGDSANFNVPDLRNRFIRGRNGVASKGDPDVNSRIAARSGGATGNQVGSLQNSATALPTGTSLTLVHSGTHTHTVSHLTGSMHQVWNSGPYSMARWNAPAPTDFAGLHSHTLTGYGASTVPVNTALYFVIKASDPQSKDGIVPAGVMAGFAGTLTAVPDNWLACDGSAHGVGLFPNLNEMISYNYGGDGVSVFNVPDLRGNFLRGTSHSTGRDPDAGTRHALNTGGAVGDATGSAQGYATFCAGLQIANAGQHSHNIALLPQDYHNAALGASGPAAKNEMEWTGDTTTSSSGGDHSHSVIGGDKETRPVNVYLDWLIASDKLDSAPPIGSVLPVGCDTSNVGNLVALIGMGWLPCDGSSLKIADPAYAALYEVVGTVYGGTPLNFFLPDLRGYFLAGASQERKAGAVIKQSTTGAAVVPITTSTDGSHQHNIDNIPTDTASLNIVMGVEIAINNPNLSATSTSNPTDHTHVMNGGDRESRPINVNVDYVIRYR
jgi:microcystin-dependent protein